MWLDVDAWQEGSNSELVRIRVESLVVWCAGAGTTAVVAERNKGKLPLRAAVSLSTTRCLFERPAAPRDEGSREESVGAMMQQHLLSHIYVPGIARTWNMYVCGAWRGARCELAPDVGRLESTSMFDDFTRRWRRDCLTNKAFWFGNP